MAAVFVASAALAALVSGCGHSKHAAVPPSASTVPGSTTTSSTTTTTPRHVHHKPVCPLMDEPPPGGKVPQRPALAVKVENLPAARPQWGLDKADIVFEEPVEGGITRFIAVYQCQDAARIEPVRSGRFVDVQILQPLGKVLFAYSGAIQPVLDAIDSSGSLLEDVGADRAGGAYSRDNTRLEPHNLATSTAALYSAGATFGFPLSDPPPPYFDYGRAPLGGSPASAVHLWFSNLDETTWTWGIRSRRWFRSYSDTGPAIQGDDVQISAANVVVLRVNEYPTPYIEDETGARENELTLTGSGQAYVFRAGFVLKGKWERPSLSHPATLVMPDGAKMNLSPGNTWEELLPSTASYRAASFSIAG
ncbi:MAG TPA: DUF3048 domain-containing protein, partial [Acidimicrobiales bacterium]|nr:DUF3048 domain-containing protein [Acidimicrobiales bacterium]